MGLTRFRRLLFLAGIICLGPVFSQSEAPTWSPIELPPQAAKDLAEVIFESDDGAIWFSFTHAGLYRSNGYAFYKIDPEAFGLEAHALDRIISMEQTTDGKIWMSARGGSVVILDADKRKAQILTETQDPDIRACLQRVWDFYEGADHSIWMASWKGLIHYQPASQQFEIFRIPFKTQRNDAVHPSVFRTIEADPKDPQILWLGGISGLFSFDSRTNRFKQHRQPVSIYRDGHSDFTKEHLQYLITDLVIDGDQLFLASWGGGVLVYDRVRDSWKQYLPKPYRTRKELDENIVTQLSLTADHTLFFTSDSGTGRIDPDRDEMELFAQNNHASPLYTYAALLDRIGSLWVSSYQDGIGTFKGTGIPLRVRKKPAFEFSGIRIGPQLIWEWQHKALPEMLSIAPDQDSLWIGFALINPVDHSAVEYQYKLPGITGDWISNGIEPAILLSSLPGGKHRLQIRAMENGSDWTYAPEIIIERKVYFYQKAWFWVLSGLGLILLVAFVIRMQIRKSIAKETIEKQMVQLKMQALQAQMNPHFIFNALNAIQNMILQENTEKASDQMNLFSRLVREILKNSEKKLVSLREDMDMMEKYLQLEQERFSDKFGWSIQLDPSVNPADCYLPPLLLQPYVENAIWHGLMPLDRPGKLTIRYQKRGKDLEIHIEDDGIGRDRSKEVRSTGKQKNGLGQQIAGNRIEMLSKLLGKETSVQISDHYPEKLDKGTHVFIRIPYIDQKIYLTISE